MTSWQGQKDLNPRHAVLETAALPAELYPFDLPLPSEGVYAFTRTFNKDVRSTDRKKVVGRQLA